VSRAPRYPKAIERQLAARLRRRQRFARHLVLEHLRSLPRHDSARRDGWLGDTIRRIGQRIREALGLAQPLAPSSLAPTGRAVDAVVATNVAIDLGVAASPLLPGLDVAREIIRRWTEEATRRIRASEEAMVDRAIEAAATAADQGQDPEAAAEAAMESGPARASFVARDVVGVLVAETTKERAKALGSRQFQWRSQRDDRVRALHRRLDGQVFDWDTGHPEEGLPGEPPACRCRAAPVASSTWTPPPGWLPPADQALPPTRKKRMKP
jgi:SPP1 gp7 family putative phage head morphogenesis protein